MINYYNTEKILFLIVSILFVLTEAALLWHADWQPQPA